MSRSSAAVRSASSPRSRSGRTPFVSGWASCPYCGRVDVRAAREEEAVDRVERLVDPLLARRHEQRAPAGRLDRADVRERDHRRRHVPDPPAHARLRVRGDPDHRSSHARRTAPARSEVTTPVEQLLLGARVVEVVVDHLVAERRARHRAALERRDRLAQRVREAVGVGLVGVALERRRQLELLLDPVQAGRDDRREREIGIRVGAGDPRLRPQRRAVPDDPEAAGPVVAPPGERRRRPRAGRVALVRVHVRRQEDRELLQAGDLPRQPAVELGRLAGERALVAPPERRVDVARAADPGVVGLRHEGDRAAVQVRDLLRPVLVDDVVVGHRRARRRSGS